MLILAGREILFDYGYNLLYRSEPYLVNDLEALQMLANDYEDEFATVIEEDGLDRQELISEMLDGYTDNINDFDEGQLEDVSERVNEIESLFGVNLSDTKARIDEAQAQHNYYEQGAIDSSDWKEREDALSSSQVDPIDSLFNTLLVD